MKLFKGGTNGLFGRMGISNTNKHTYTNTFCIQSLSLDSFTFTFLTQLKVRIRDKSHGPLAAGTSGPKAYLHWYTLRKETEQFEPYHSFTLCHFKVKMFV